MGDVKSEPGSGLNVLYQDVTRGRALKLVIPGMLGAAAVVVLTIRMGGYRAPDRVRSGAAIPLLNQRWDELSRDQRYAKMTLGGYVYWLSAGLVYIGLENRRE